MKVRLNCSQCLIDRTEAGMEGPLHEHEPASWFDAQDLNELNAYSATCPKGHATRLAIQNPKFEILFDAAALALIDGYHREAVATFGTALERAFEFFCRVAASHQGISTDKFDATWKLVSRQSERQFGAFTFAYVALTGEPPPFTKSEHDEMMKLRNDVVHNGLFVDRAQAERFGTFAYRAINALIKIMKERAAAGVTKEISRILAASRDPNATMTTTMVQVTMLSMIRGGEPRPFEAALADFQRGNCWIDWQERVTLADLAKASGKQPEELLELLEAALRDGADDSANTSEGNG